MKKWICTSSLFMLFCGTLGVLTLVGMIPVHHSVWWASDDSAFVLKYSPTVPVAVWFADNILFPIALLAIAYLLAWPLWALAKWTCGKWRA